MKSHIISLAVHLNEDLGITSVTISNNTTGLPSDSTLIKLVAVTLLESIRLNKDELVVSDLLSELGMEVK